MIKDSKAEALEAKGLWRRAAARWMDVFDKCRDDRGREWIAARRAHCLSLAQGKAVKPLLDTFGDVKRAASATQEQMGIAQPDGKAFRLPESGKKEYCD